MFSAAHPEARMRGVSYFSFLFFFFLLAFLESLSCSSRSSHARCFLMISLFCFFFCFFSLFGITQLFTLRLAYEVFPNEKQVHDTSTHHPLTPLSIHRSALETGFRGSVFPITTYYYYAAAHTPLYTQERFGDRI